MMANNADWLDALGYIPLLRDVGIHFTINRMLGFDSVKLRLDREQPLTFLEFNYMILQSYDFRELSRRHGVTLQIGGSDQWGNIVAGMELTRRTDAQSGLRPDHAADHHRVRRARWARPPRARSGSPPIGCPPTTTGSSGATPRTPTSAASCACSPTCHWPKSPGWKALGGAEINEAKKILATEATALAHGADQAAASRRNRPPRLRGRRSRRHPADA